MFKVAVGHSEDIDSPDAVEEIIAQCKEKLGELTAKAGLLFASMDHDY